MKITRWEYMDVYSSCQYLDPHDLNVFGSEGWELVAIIPYLDEDGITYANSAYFKRPLLDLEAKA